MKSVLIWRILFCFGLMIFISIPPVLSEEYVIPKIGQIQKSEEDISRNDLLNAVRAGNPQNVDTRAKIVNLLKDVKEAKITAEEFYQKVSQLEMPAGMELRHVLMEVKKDVGNYLGEQGLRSVFGEIYQSGATRVEATVLSHRKQVVMDTIKQAIVIYRDQVKAQTGEYPKNTFYYGEVGGWPNESFQELKFAGDIDFNFLSGDLDAAMALKKIFDDLIRKKYNGRSPEEIDIPCTVHGMATSEVYVGKHGQTFAETVTKVAWEIDFDNARPDMDLKANPVPFKLALEQMVLEAKVDEVHNALPDLKESKFPHQPGISLEMIRHFEHDIAGKDVFTNLESFVKAAKYTERAYSFLLKELGDGATFDPLLKKFVEKLTKWKKDPKAQVAFIKLYFEKIGQPLPFNVDLEINADGKGRATLEANQKVIETFWDICRKAMWDGANQVIAKKTADLKARVAALGKDDIEESKAIYEELVKLDEMLEIEHKVLHDDVAGVHGKTDPEYEKLMGEFREMRADYKQKSAKFGHVEYIDPELGKSYKWVETMLKMGKPDNIKWALAGIMSLPGRANDYLDFLDDGLLTKIRQGEGDDYIKMLRKGQGLYWEERANKFLAGTPFEGRFDAQFKSMEAQYNKAFKDIEIKLNDSYSRLLNSRGLKAVQGINNAFNESVSSSKVGSGMMTGMMLISLKDELPLYWDKLMNDDYEGLAAEFFKRRVPFGGAVERAVMGDYYGAGWEFTTTIIPPLGIASAAKGVGESVAMMGIEAYISEELETFIDSLYQDAEFKIASMETVGEDLKVSKWELLTVSYQGKKFEYNDLVKMETADAREMGECLKRPSNQRPECFPMEKMSNGVFEWWRNRDAFEEAFKRSDPWLQLILEMKKHPDVGPKLEEHFRYQIYTRLEQLKVKFLVELKKRLEERRAGEEAIISGKFAKLYEELLKMAEDLDIKVQLQENIEEKFGGEVVQFLTWMKDYLRGVMREINEDVDVWDVYEELAAFVSEHAGIYKKVLDQRASAEKILAGAQDQGLRILTGPYFLDGEGSFDAKAGSKWTAFPKQAEDKMAQQMQAIKSETEADPSELDLAEGSYDAGVLKQLTYHESYAELWIHVNSRFLVADVPSYLGSSGALQTQPKPEGSANDSDLAVERFKFHQKRVEEILEEYRKHYEGEKKEEDKEDGEEEKKEGEDAAAGLEGLLGRMEALYDQVKTEADALKNKADTYKSQMDDYEKRTNAMSAKIRDFIVANSDLSVFRRGNPQEQFNKMKSLSEQLARLRDKTQGFTLSVCQFYEQMKGAGDVKEADAMMNEANSQLKECTSAYDEAQQVIQEMEIIKQSISGPAQGEDRAAKADALIEEAARVIAEGDSLIEQGKAIDESLKGMERYKAQAAGIVGEADALIPKDETDNREDRKERKKFEKIFGRIKTVEEKVKTTVDESVRHSYKHGLWMGNVDTFKKGLNELLDNLKKEAGTEALKEQSDANKDILSMYEAGMLFKDPIEEAMNQAKTCMAGIQQEHGKIATPEARVAAADCSKFSGTHPQWDSADQVVRCQCTDGEVWAKSKNQCISKKENDLASLDCRTYSNTKPVWNEALQRAVCDCVSGTAWNSSSTGCIKPRSQQIAEANCERFGQAKAVWDNQTETAYCECYPGYEINASRTLCVPIPPPPPAYDPYDNYDSGGYGGYNTGYDSGYNDGYDNGGNTYGADDFVNDMQGIMETLNRGNNRSGGGGSGSSRPCSNTGNSIYDTVINGAVNCDGGGSDSGYSGGRSGGRDCANDFTMGSSGLYGNTTFTCNCSGWGFDPAYGYCREG
ncbi:MAG: hypothetical protein KC733_03015, partial [Candidatus Omnitrophica bacterium]|nr:hypothetical protein [Candidatus Omnitrophota bacterium]